MRRQKRSAIFLSSPHKFGFTLHAKRPGMFDAGAFSFFTEREELFLFYQVMRSATRKWFPRKQKGILC